MDFKTVLTKLQEKHPIVHCLTNYVTVNDVANVLLACGGSPIMADDPKEATDIASLTQAVVINIGTLNSRTIEAMILAGKRANELGHPVIFDPVGAGASALRTETAFTLMKEIKFSVIRGNISEISALMHDSVDSHGVDANMNQAITEENLQEKLAVLAGFSRQTGSVIAVTGAIDLVTDGKRACIIRNGHPMMARVTGTGCMLSGVVGACCAAHEDQLEAAAAAIGMMAFSGEQAYAQLCRAGTSTYRTLLIDTISLMTPDDLQGGVRCELQTI